MSTADSQNPFCLEPVRLLSKFFGREKETRRTLSFLHRLQCVSIVGPARIGKTSFLSHVAHPQVRAEKRLAEEHIFIRFDSRSLADLDEDQCYHYIREDAVRQIAVALDEVGIRPDKMVGEADSQTPFFGLRTLCQSARALGLKLVIVLDDLDVLNQNRLLGDIFYSALRSLHTNYEIAYLVASQSQINKLERVCPDGSGSPFFNIFQQIPIGPFTDEESRQLVVTLLSLASAEFPEFVIDCILELGHNEPRRLQRAGCRAFQMWHENHEDWPNGSCEEIRRRLEESQI